MSFYRMAEHGRGPGVENSIDKAWMANALQVGRGFLSRATNAMLGIFPDAEVRGMRVLT